MVRGTGTLYAAVIGKVADEIDYCSQTPPSGAVGSGRRLARRC